MTVAMARAMAGKTLPAGREPAACRGLSKAELEKILGQVIQSALASAIASAFANTAPWASSYADRVRARLPELAIASDSEVNGLRKSLCRALSAGGTRAQARRIIMRSGFTASESAVLVSYADCKAGQ
jgi:hypothetical protein